MVSNAKTSADVSILIQSLGVVLSAALVVTNKVVLSLITYPGKTALLTFMHYGITCSWIRGQAFCKDVKRREVPIKWILLITSMGTCSVLTSNLVLELSSVTFHQISKLASLPCGAFIDYYVHGKMRTWRELLLLFFICLAVYVTTVGKDNFDLTVGATCAALIYVGTYVSVAALLRHVCQRFELSTSEFMYLSTPYGLLASFLLLIISMLYESSAAEFNLGANQNFVAGSVPMLCLNAVLAVSVQWFSTWTAGNSTTMLYAVVGQAKTAATIALGVFVFQIPLSIRTIVGLIICVTTAFALALSEVSLGQTYRTTASRCTTLSILLSTILLSALLFCEFHGLEFFSLETRSVEETQEAILSPLVTAPTEVMSSESDIHFRVLTAGDRIEDTLSCGGCTALHQLAIELRLLGHQVKTLSWTDMEKTGWDCDVQHENTAVVFSEGLTQSCKTRPRVTVRWILAPLGAIFPHQVTESWPERDWVYNYGTYAPGTALPVPDSNLLMVTRNPIEGDIFDPLAYSIQAQRKGTCFTFRKLDKFHSAENVLHLHEPGDTPLAEMIENAAEQFTTHEYFVSYDPYTYLSFAAAMLGCVPIVHPLGNMTKFEWILSTAWGPYIRESNRTVIMDGVAYGNSTTEVSRARENLPFMREEFFRVKIWGKGTVKRFVRDVMEHVEGTEQYEGRKLVSEFYPKGWNPGIFQV